MFFLVLSFFLLTLDVFILCSIGLLKGIEKLCKYYIKLTFEMTALSFLNCFILILIFT